MARCGEVSCNAIGCSPRRLHGIVGAKHGRSMVMIRIGGVWRRARNVVGRKLRRRRVRAGPRRSSTNKHEEVNK